MQTDHFVFIYVCGHVTSTLTMTDQSAGRLEKTLRIWLIIVLTMKSVAAKASTGQIARLKTGSKTPIIAFVDNTGIKTA